MASSVEIQRMFFMACPLYASLFSMVLLFWNARKNDQRSAKLNNILIAYFFMVFLTWVYSVCFYLYPMFFLKSRLAGFLAFMLMQVLFYRFIFEVTKTSQKEPFFMLHAMMPILLLFVAEMLTTDAMILLRFCYSLVYLALGFNRLLLYKRFIRNLSVNGEKTSVKWIWIAILLSVIALPLPMLWLVVTDNGVIISVLMGIHMMLLLSLYAYICLHVVRNNKFMITLEELEDVEILEMEAPHQRPATDDPGMVSKKTLLNKEMFEKYMRTEKPYLNPDLRITDLVDIFHVNRTYISSFINLEYHMNFSSYINKHRLNEYNRLKKIPQYSKFEKQELIEIAGFNSYRSFLRTKKERLNS
jgi:hypothetical protein